MLLGSRLHEIVRNTLKMYNYKIKIILDSQDPDKDNLSRGDFIDFFLPKNVEEEHLGFCRC